MRWLRAGGLAGCILSLAGCAAREVGELYLLGGPRRVVSHVRYGPDPRQRLDLYPVSRSPRAAPVVVFLYGGRWQYGSRRDYRLLGQALADRGFVTVIPDYRLYPEVRFPAWVEDAAATIRWVSQNVGAYGGDSSRIFVVGHSSGAHTTVLLALDPHYLRQAGVGPGLVRGFVSLAGPVATTWTEPDVQALMGPRERWRATYPMELATGSAPPLLLLHGARDRTVAVENSLRLAARLRQLGGCARVITYRGLGHVGILLAMALPQFVIAPVLEDVVRFLREPLAGCERSSNGCCSSTNREPVPETSPHRNGAHRAQQAPVDEGQVRSPVAHQVGVDQVGDHVQGPDPPLRVLRRLSGWDSWRESRVGCGCSYGGIDCGGRCSCRSNH